MSVYSQILEGVLLPCHNQVKGRQYVRHRHFLNESQWWSREQAMEFQWQELKALLAHCFHSVPYYQKKYAGAGIRLEDIKTREDFARLPILTRAEVNEHRESLCSTDYGGKLLPHATGGSSGVPTRFYRTIESYDWRTAAMDRVYGWTGCHLGERAVYLWGAPVGHVSTRQRIKTRAYEFVLRHLVFNTFSQTEQRWDEIYEGAIAFRPKLIVGYVSSLQECSAYLQAKGAVLPGVKAVIAAAEPLSERTREQISQGFGAPVFNTYGSREFMSIAGECEFHNGLHINSENILVETALPLEDGPSELLITDLHNYGMPFVRYSIGDAGVLEDSSCPCGRGLPRLRSIDGRVLDLLRMANGRLVPGEFFPHLLMDAPEIIEYQVEQKSINHIVVNAVLSGPLSEKSRTLLDKEFQKVFGQTTKVEIKGVNKIPMLSSGKKRTVVGLPPNDCSGSERPLAVERAYVAATKND